VAYQTLPILLAPYQRPGYRSGSMIVFGSQQENTDLFAQQATFAKSWNEMYAFPKMMSTPGPRTTVSMIRRATRPQFNLR
jgi:hypothetical protein